MPRYTDNVGEGAVPEEQDRAEEASAGLQEGYPGSTVVDYGLVREIPIEEKEPIVNPPITHEVNIDKG